MKKYDVFELSLKGKTAGNPYMDYDIKGIFTHNRETKEIKGFYNGEGEYIIRFMPSYEGTYTYRVEGSFSEQSYEGSMNVEGVLGHGPVHTNGGHFYYADGTPHYSVGTTCYNWTQQSEALQNETLETLKDSGFNKIRFCVFPKHYDYNYRNPIHFPYEGTCVDATGMNKYNFSQYTPESKGNNWDFQRFNPKYFANIEAKIHQLRDLGIEADIILFHPYDRWGFSKMTREENKLYLQYVIARFSAYSNVWWSLANEYELCKYKTMKDWMSLGEMLVEEDPYTHLRSCHNCYKLFDHSMPWITHCSIQRQAGHLELDFIPQWRAAYKKPVVIDEMCYEGDLEHYWGNISGEEMLRRMWKVYILGGYPGHSETYENEDIWWSHGGKLYGESYKRVKFLHEMMTQCGPLSYVLPEAYGKSENQDVKLYYFGEHRPAYKILDLTNERSKVYVIDTWNMTIEDKGVCEGVVKIDLKSKAYFALMIKKVTSETE